MPSSQAMAVVGRRLPGMIPRASTRMTKSATLSIRITQDGSVPASGNGHSTGEPLKLQTRGTVPERAIPKSYPGVSGTKLKP